MKPALLHVVAEPSALRCKLPVSPVKAAANGSRDMPLKVLRCKGCKVKELTVAFTESGSDSF